MTLLMRIMKGITQSASRTLSAASIFGLLGLTSAAEAQTQTAARSSFRVGPNGSSLLGINLWGQRISSASSTIRLSDGSSVQASPSAFDPNAPGPGLINGSGWTFGLGPNGGSFLGGGDGSAGFGFLGLDLRNGIIQAKLDNGKDIEIRIDELRFGIGFNLVFRASVRVVGGAFERLCPESDSAYMVPGAWSESVLGNGQGISFACRGSSVAKCVEYGYKPWSIFSGERDLHRACVRMLRADYCGDGRSFTVDGTVIGFGDGVGIQSSVDTLALEATWGPNGATCIERTRIPDAGLNESCVQARVQETCDASTALLTSAVVGPESPASAEPAPASTETVESAPTPPSPVAAEEAVSSDSSAEEDDDGDDRKRRKRKK